MTSTSPRPETFTSEPLKTLSFKALLKDQNNQPKGGIPVTIILDVRATSNGSLLRPFHASLLQPAVHSQSQVWPAAIRYTHADGSHNMAPAYVDELSFGESLSLILSQAIIYAEVEFMPPIAAHGKARRELARDAELAIAGALNLTVSR